MHAHNTTHICTTVHSTHCMSFISLHSNPRRMARITAISSTIARMNSTKCTRLSSNFTTNLLTVTTTAATWAGPPPRGAPWGGADKGGGSTHQTIYRSAREYARLCTRQREVKVPPHGRLVIYDMVLFRRGCNAKTASCRSGRAVKSMNGPHCRKSKSSLRRKAQRNTQRSAEANNVSTWRISTFNSTRNGAARSMHARIRSLKCNEHKKKSHETANLTSNCVKNRKERPTKSGPWSSSKKWNTSRQ